MPSAKRIRRASTPGGGGGGAPPPAAAATWQQAATQLRRLAAEGQGNELVWLEAGAAALTPAQVNVQARQAVLPSPKPMAAVLRAICGATEVRGRGGAAAAAFCLHCVAVCGLPEWAHR